MILEYQRPLMYHLQGPKLPTPDSLKHMLAISN
jgi:hypothetical protein